MPVTSESEILNIILENTKHTLLLELLTSLNYEKITVDHELLILTTLRNHQK